MCTGMTTVEWPFNVIKLLITENVACAIYDRYGCDRLVRHEDVITTYPRRQKTKISHIPLDSGRPEYFLAIWGGVHENNLPVFTSATLVFVLKSVTIIFPSRPAVQIMEFCSSSVFKHVISSWMF